MTEKEYVAGRARRFIAWMKEQKLDAAVISRPEDIFYFSRFNPIIASKPPYFIFTGEGRACLLTQSLRLNHAREESAVTDIQGYGVWGDIPILDGDPIGAIAKIIGAKNGKIRLGVEYGALNLLTYRKLTDAIPAGETVDVSGQVEKMKQIKDIYEIGHIRKASALADVCADTMRKELAAGETEAAVCMKGHYAMKKYWLTHFPEEEIAGFSEGGILDALMCWCNSGSRIAFACDCPKPQLPKKGELVVSYIWGKISGYHSEVERTCFTGRLDALRERAVATVQESRAAMLAALKPGITFGDLFEVGCEAYRRHDLVQMIPGSFGHGIGLSAHESLGIGKNRREVIQPNMVFTVEPGLTSLEWGGGRISETVLATEDGYELLTKADASICSVRE